MEYFIGLRKIKFRATLASWSCPFRGGGGFFQGALHQAPPAADLPANRELWGGASLGIVVHEESPSRNKIGALRDLPKEINRLGDEGGGMVGEFQSHKAAKPHAPQTWESCQAVRTSEEGGR